MSELTDERLKNLLEAVVAAPGGPTVSREVAVMALSELRDRRSRDLTADDREALEHIRNKIVEPLVLGRKPWGAGVKDLAVLDKLLARKP